MYNAACRTCRFAVFLGTQPLFTDACQDGFSFRKPMPENSCFTITRCRCAIYYFFYLHVKTSYGCFSKSTKGTLGQSGLSRVLLVLFLVLRTFCRANATIHIHLHLKQIAKTAASGISAFKPVLEPAGKVLNVPVKNLQNGDKLRQGGAVLSSGYGFLDNNYSICIL